MALNKSFYTRGFAFIEVMATIAIIGSIAAFTIPYYLKHRRNADYNEFVDALSPYKAGVLLCYETTHSLNNCNGGENGVPRNFLGNANTGSVRWILTSQGAIYLFPNNTRGFTLLGDYMLLSAQLNNMGTLTWRFAGPALTNSYVSNS